ncbi:MAG: 2-oxoacid:ferredoxin oxidoreductase subunit beta [Candidatus Cloacimonetes bacterium]|nr:2-oxoacid:ferredoxin oxidoreductase subunit beta [Candidatus Cloacimonadota bacterium]
MRNLTTTKENSWCPGCGNFGIFNAVKKSIESLVEMGEPMENIVMSSGIGCHGKMFDYLNISGIFGLHGRAMAGASGIKIANPNLKVIVFGGDGDSMGEGLEHTLFAAKRNIDLTMILHNNGVYGLTTGQASPLSLTGYRGLSTPQGNLETPFHTLGLIMEAGASFVARAYSARIPQLSELITQAVLHKGFSFIEVLQPCVSYNNTYDLYNSKTKNLAGVPASDEEAIKLAKDEEDIYLGVFRQEQRPVFDQEVQSKAKTMDRKERFAYLESRQF